MVWCLRYVRVSIFCRFAACSHQRISGSTGIRLLRYAQMCARMDVAQRGASVECLIVNGCVCVCMCVRVYFVSVLVFEFMWPPGHVFLRRYAASGCADVMTMMNGALLITGRDFQLLYGCDSPQ